MAVNTTRPTAMQKSVATTAILLPMSTPFPLASSAARDR